jgi:hypothetical protein
MAMTFRPVVWATIEPVVWTVVQHGVTDVA